MIRRTINIDKYAFGTKEANHKGHNTLNTFEYNHFSLSIQNPHYILKITHLAKGKQKSRLINEHMQKLFLRE
jgi:hypothetical protein